MSRRRRVARTAFSLAVAAGAVALAGCGGRESPPNLVLFTIDTQRADRLGCYGNARSPSPFVDRLAREGVVFERCFAPRGQTHPSLASLLTGLYPITHGLRQNGMDLPPSITPLPVLLQRRGYRTAAFAANLDRTRWPFWIRGFETAVDGVQGRLEQEGFEAEVTSQRVWDERVTEAALRWIAELPDDGAPFFLWVHLYDVHDPYTPEPEAARRFVDPEYHGPLRAAYDATFAGAQRDVLGDALDRYTLGEIDLAPADLAFVKALVDAGTAGCDARLASICAALEQRGLLENALAVVTADHGDTLADHHRYFLHGNSIYDEVLRVPLVLRWPGTIEPGTRVAGLAQLHDLFPTFLEAAGIAPSADCEGVSLLDAARGAAADGTADTGRTFAFAEWEDLIYAVSDGRFKYVHNPGGVRPRKPPYHATPNRAFPYECFELYDLAADPRETENAFTGEHPEAARLRRVLEDFLAEAAHQRPMRVPDVADPALQALGYVGSAAGRDVLRIPCGDRR